MATQTRPHMVIRDVRRFLDEVALFLHAEISESSDSEEDSDDGPAVVVLLPAEVRNRRRMVGRFILAFYDFVHDVACAHLLATQDVIGMPPLSDALRTHFDVPGFHSEARVMHITYDLGGFNHVRVFNVPWSIFTDTLRELQQIADAAARFSASVKTVPAPQLDIAGDVGLMSHAHAY